MANTTDVIKIEISTDQLLETEGSPSSRYQPRVTQSGASADMSFGSATRIFNSMPIYSNEFTPLTNAISSASNFGKNIGSISKGSMAGVVSLAVTTMSIMNRVNKDFKKYVNSQEMKRRAYGENR